MRTPSYGRACGRAIAIAVSLQISLVTPAIAEDSTGGAVATPLPPPPTAVAAPTTPLPNAQLAPDGRTALPPQGAPDDVKIAIYAANELTRKPYRYGGGHTATFLDNAYDCSGSVSFVLHGAGLLTEPLDSSSFMRWGARGKGQWITIYTNPWHAFMVIAGLRFDTSGPGARGPRWRARARFMRGFKTRHPESL